MEGILLSKEWVGTQKQETDGQRTAAAMLLDVCRTLGGVTQDDAERMRTEFLDQYGRAVHGVNKVKASGGKLTVRGETDFLKAGLRPPLLSSLSEAADKVYKLRKLGCFPLDQPLTVDMSAVRAAHGKRWESLA